MFNRLEPLFGNSNLTKCWEKLSERRPFIEESQFLHECLQLLWDASAVGDHELVEKLISKNKLKSFDLNVAYSPTGRPPVFTPLMAATYGNHRETIKRLVRHGANINIKLFSMSALDLAIENKHIHKDTVRLLLKSKAEANSPSKMEEGRSPLELAILHKREDVVEVLLQEQADVNQKDTYGSLLTYACGKELAEKKIVKLLLANVEKNNKLLNQSGNSTPLNCAIDNIEIVEMLLKAGANPNCIGNHENETPLTRAIIKDAKDQVKTLLDHKADVNQRNRAGDTPLTVAVKSENSHAATFVAWLFDKNPALTPQKTYTLLEHAVKNRHSQPCIVEKLLATQPVFPMEKIYRLLSHAVKNNNSNEAVVKVLLDKKDAVVKVLLDKKTNFNPKDHYDYLYGHLYTLLKYIVNNEKSNENIFNTLLNKIKILPKDVDSLLLDAVQNKNNTENIVKTLLSYSDSPTKDDKYRLLEHAVKNGKENSVKMLLNYKPALTHTEVYTLLTYVTQNEHDNENILQMLLDYTTSLNKGEISQPFIAAVDRTPDLSQTEIYTLLTHAVNTKHNKEKVVAILLSHSNTLSAEDNYKLLEPAVKNGKENSVKTLLSHKPKLTKQQIHTLLIHAVKNEQSNENIVKLLLDHMQTAVQNNEYDDTPLEPEPPRENKNGRENVVNASLSFLPDITLESKKGHENVVNPLLDFSTDVTLESKNSHENIVNPLLDLSTDVTLESKNSHENVVNALLDFPTDVTLESKNSHENVVNPLLDLSTDVTLESKNSHENIVNALLGLSADVTLESKNSHENVINTLIDLPTDVPLKDTSRDASLTSVAQHQGVNKTQGDTKEAPLPEKAVKSQSRKENIIIMLLNAPLYHAVSHLNSNEKIVKALLEAKASVLRTFGSNGTPLEQAIKNENRKTGILQMLLEYGTTRISSEIRTLAKRHKATKALNTACLQAEMKASEGIRATWILKEQVDKRVLDMAVDYITSSNMLTTKKSRLKKRP